MSMFENKTKPELEAGNYIAYADEPNTVVSGSGGIVFLEFDYDNGVYVPKFTYNEAKTAFLAGNFLYVRGVYSPDNVYQHYESFAVDQLIDNGTGEFTMTTSDPTFKATSPDELMVQGD